MNNPVFELFEEICTDLADKDEPVLIDDDFSPLTVEGVKKWAKEAVTTEALAKALEYLKLHFEVRGSVLPFTYDLATGRVTATNREYIDFVASAQEQRSLSKESEKFEVATSLRLETRLTGLIHRVGSPRKKHKRRKEFAKYLKNEFSFVERVLIGNDKDGGFDILWFPPLGAFPFRAMVSIQCKNAPYNRDEGFKSVGRAKQSFQRHSHASSEECHLHCVVYNDYVDESTLEHAREACFVPLGLSDLAPLTKAVSVLQL